MTISDVPLFSGPRIRLTALRQEDTFVFMHWYEDSEFVRQYDANAAVPRSIHRVRQQFDEDDKSNIAFPFAIRQHHTDEMIGICAVDGISWNNRNGWLSIAFGDPAHRGQGYGEEVMRLLLRFCFHEINLHRVQLTVFSYNERAAKLYERLGFTREGVWREAILRDGQAFDMVCYSMLAREYAAKLAGEATS
ncbi:MAG: putative acetyltransferase [Chloroflexi bacterium OLB15]|nr:MAG: putative acetyltransferase [Chloroflexi bacterium OLB15]